MVPDDPPTLNLDTASTAPGWVQRAQPWLGTLVRIGVRGLDEATADAAIDRSRGSASPASDAAPVMASTTCSYVSGASGTTRTERSQRFSV